MADSPGRSCGAAAADARSPESERTAVPGRLVRPFRQSTAPLATVWLVFSLAGVPIANFGFVICCGARRATPSTASSSGGDDGVLLMKDRLATVAIWTGALVALVALLAVVILTCW